MRCLSNIAKWAGRAIAALLLLFWGAFFVEHLGEWFLGGGGRYPPLWVWRQQFLHFVVLAGLGLMLKWDRLGTAVMLAGSLAFFGLIHWNRFPFIALLNLAPVACFVVYWLVPRRA